MLQQQQQQQQMDVVTLMEALRKSFEKITNGVNKANMEQYPVATAQKDLAETKVLLKKVQDMIKTKNLSGYPAGPVESSSVATKQKHLIESLKQTLQQTQVNANTIAKAFNETSSTNTTNISITTATVKK